MGPTNEYPMMTQRNAYVVSILDILVRPHKRLTCHQVNPALIIDEAMTNVLRLKLSAIQKDTCGSGQARRRSSELTKFQ
jgi:hypothetical protein